MTDQIIATNSLGSVDYFKNTSDLYLILERFKSAAIDCQFIYNNPNHSSVNLMLLDADVVFEAIPSLKLAAAIDSDECRSKSSFIETKSFSPIGPHTLSYHLTHLDSYSVPPGASIEILRRKQNLLGVVSSRAKRFLSVMDVAAESPDPLSVIRSDVRSEQGSLKEIVREELHELTNVTSHIGLVDGILDKATSMESVLSDDGNTNVGSAYRKSYDILSGRRPQRQFSNFCDALNVEVLYQLYQTKKKIRHGRHIVPTLITDTREVDLLEQPLRSLVVHQEHGRLINKSEYMVVVNGLLGAANGSRSYCVDLSRLLTQDIQALQTAYSVAKNDLESGCSDYLGRIETFQLRLGSFLQEWSRIFMPAENEAHRDRKLYLKELIGAEQEKMLSAKDPKLLRKTLKKVRNDIMQYKHPNHDVWKSLWKPDATLNIRSSLHAWNAYSIQLCANDGSLLSELRFADVNNLGFNVKETLRLHSSVRAVAFCPSLSVNGLMVADLYRSIERQESITLTWKHPLAATEMLTLLHKCALRFTPSNDECGIIRYVCADNTTEEISVSECAWAKVEKEAMGEGRVLYLELEISGVILFADLDYLDDGEQQAGFNYNPKIIQADRQETLVEFACESSPYVFPRLLVADLFASLVRSLPKYTSR